MRLDGKTAAITGGNSGIGLAIARAFRDAGARVAILGREPKTLVMSPGRKILTGSSRMSSRPSAASTSSSPTPESTVRLRSTRLPPSSSTR